MAGRLFFSGHRVAVAQGALGASGMLVHLSQAGAHAAHVCSMRSMAYREVERYNVHDGAVQRSAARARVCRLCSKRLNNLNGVAHRSSPCALQSLCTTRVQVKRSALNAQCSTSPSAATS